MISAQVDHLVVMADSLASGVDWCEQTLGITPGPGGKHPLMATHNRLFSVAGPAYPRAYFEIIAIQPDAVATRAPGSQRWFDMDDPQLQARVARQGPQLIAFVASCSGVVSAVKALAALGLDRGEVIEASRQSASTLLKWRMTVRSDGQRLFYGGLPTLIQWGDASQDPAQAAHPLDAMEPSGVTLQALQISHPRPEKLLAAHRAIGLVGVAISQGAPNLSATLQTPRGLLTLESKGI